MKVKNITIKIQSLEEDLKQFVEVAEAIRQGKPPRKRIEGISFESLEAMRSVLTPKRLELLHLIREKHPDSIYALARIAKRDLKNVQDDVALLARIDLVSLRRAKTARNRVTPRVNYDSIQLQIPVI